MTLREKKMKFLEDIYLRKSYHCTIGHLGKKGKLTDCVVYKIKESGFLKTFEKYNFKSMLNKI